MSWLLIISLMNYEFGPVPVDQITCRSVEARVAAGLLVIVERDSGAVMPIRRARCIRQHAGA